MKKTKLSPLEIATLLAITAILLWPMPLNPSGQPTNPITQLLLSLIGNDPVIFMVIEKLANVLLFVPFGYILAKRTNPIAIAAIYSLTAELLQKFVITGRVFDLTDIIANTVGASLGLLLLNWAKARSAHR